MTRAPVGSRPGPRGGRSLASLVLVGLAATASCRRDEPSDAAKDAGAAPQPGAPIEVAPELGLRIRLPAGWRSISQDARDLEAGIRLRAEREPPKTPGRVPAPIRLVVSTRPLDAPIELEALMRGQLEATRDALSPADSRVQRSTTARWAAGAVPVAAFRLDYEALDPKGGPGVAVVQRSAFAVRAATAAGPPHAIHLSITHLGVDDESLGTEVDGVLRSMDFKEPAAR
jgi:hypothetical protein